MLEALRGWTRSDMAGGIVLAAPDGTVRVRIRARAPRVSLRALVDGVADAAPAGAAVELTVAPRPLVTVEGELAAIFEVVSRGAAMTQTVVGVVMADEHFAVIEATADAPAALEPLRSLGERLTCGHVLGLGRDRWRPFRYPPPPRWHGVARPRSDLWLHPDYPRAPGAITVFRARPAEGAGAVYEHSMVHEHVPAELAVTSPAERRLVSADGALAGDLVLRAGVVGGRPRRVAEVRLVGGDFVYPLRLETNPARAVRDLEAFVTLVVGVRALPARPLAQAAPAFAHWFE